MKTRGSRRSFIANIAGAAAATRLLPLMPRAAFAATEAPKRLLCVFSPLGYLENFFWPRGEGADFTLGETQKVLTPYKDKLLYVDGLMLSGHNTGDKRRDRAGVKWDNEHGQGISGVFTGSIKDLQGVYSMTESIDQTVAKHLYAQKATAYKSIALAASSGNPGPHGSAFFFGGGQPVTPITVPRVAFDTYFDKLQIGEPSAADAAAAARRKLLKQSVLDTVRSELDAVCSRLGTSERRLCDAHLAGLRSVEKRIQDSGEGKPAQCAKPGQPIAKEGTYDTERDVRANIEIIRSAFACDLTRVATLQIGNADGGVDLDGYAGHHETSHSVTAQPSAKVVADHKAWDQFFAKQWLYLLQQLSSIPEGSGSMLDNTLIVFGSDTTSGQSLAVGAHNGYRFPIWMAGGSNFAFPTGRQLTFPAMPPDTTANAANMWGYNEKGRKYLYHNSLLVSVAQAFGMNINSYGTYDQGVGPVPGLK